MRRRHLLLTAALALWRAGATAAQALGRDPARQRRTSTRATAAVRGEAPCRIDYAILAAASGDDVALASGDYYATGTTPWAGLPEVKAGVTVHGTPGRPLPVLHGLVAANATPFILIRNGGTLSDVERGRGRERRPHLLVRGDDRARRRCWTARSPARAATAAPTSPPARCSAAPCATSPCLGSGAGTVNALTGTSTAPTVYTVRNVTAITTATAGDGVRVGVSTQTSSMNVTNTIARGVTSDVSSRAGLAGGDVTLTLDHSNWNAQNSGGAGTARIVQGAGNQYGPTAAQPLFADAAGRGLPRRRPARRRSTPAPPTRSTARWPWAAPRASVGAATDIGAYEFVPPPPPPRRRRRPRPLRRRRRPPRPRPTRWRPC